jgi:16S rRNA (cytosine967-C5)-methyltransferase
MADPARSAALDLLAGVLDRGESLADQTPALAALAPGDRARAQRLATGVLRQLGPLDRALQPFLKKSPPLSVRNILRLALSELAGGAAPHGVVHNAVEAARAINPAFSGMTNAILRRIDPASVKGIHRLPDWLRQRLIETWGNRALEGMERVFARPAPIDLTLRPGAAPEGLEAETLPTGSLRLAPGAQVSTLPGYEAGAFWVQDAAAALAVRLLGDVAGKRVLDLCAAPGGKTMQLAAAGAEVTSLDISGPRLERLRENLARTGLKAEILAEDALHWTPEAPFDAILLDAPCSATGTIRRHPDLPHLRRPEDVQALTRLQADLADRARLWLKPGGKLVFCTCSLLPEEGEAQAARLVDLGMKAEKPDLPGIEPQWWGAHGLRLRPDYWEKQGGMDGFFMALLAR